MSSNDFRLSVADRLEIEGILRSKLNKKIVEWGVELRDEIKLRIDEGGNMPYDTERLRDSVTLVEPPIGNVATRFEGNAGSRIVIDTSADGGIRKKDRNTGIVIKTGKYEEDHEGFVPYVAYIEFGTMSIRAYAPFFNSEQKLTKKFQEEFNLLIEEAAEEVKGVIARSVTLGLARMFKIAF